MIHRLWLLCVLGFFVALTGCASPSALTCDTTAPAEALALVAADRIDGALRDVAQSTRAIGDAYARLKQLPPPPAPAMAMAEMWRQNAFTQGNTTGFRSWPPTAERAQLQSQAPYVAFYCYGDSAVSDAAAEDLGDLFWMTPTLRTAYESFDYSWVYITTVHNAFAIYPYLPMDEAVNNDPPTQQIFYTAANFDERKVGWTPPYLDLAGQGMMVTAAYPIYAGDTLLGVASRDVTIDQMSDTLLAAIAKSSDAQVLIVDRDGLLIDASDSALAKWAIEVNTKAKAAVAYCLPAESLKDKAHLASPAAWANAAVDAVRSSDPDRKTGVIRAQAAGRAVVAAPIESTGWLLVLVLP